MWTGTKLDGTVVEKMIEKPRYGGVHIFAREDEPTIWDHIARTRIQTWQLNTVYDMLAHHNLKMGPAGTGEWTGLLGIGGLPQEFFTGAVAESWEVPDETTIIYHIRQGVHFALDPTSEASRLVDGRELTADDVVFSWKRDYTYGYQSTNYRYLSDMENLENSLYVSPTDKWAVVVKSEPGMNQLSFMGTGYYWNYVMAPEVIERYGPTITDWGHLVGTGPFMLKDYVEANALTYIRNPNYWMRDPFFPENQLPYVDGFNILIIPDASTRLAALRTGKIDTLYDQAAEDAESLMKTTPELEWKSYLQDTPAITMRVDKPELPFYDVRVRQALMMAVNHQELIDLYHEGKAELFAYPVIPIPEFRDIYTPLEEMPESVQELYGYHPDKARRLLTEAGYPQGFETEVVVWKSEDIDLLSIIKEYWAKIGVDLKIDVKESGVFESIKARKTVAQMIIDKGGSQHIYSLPYQRLGGFFNCGMINEPWVEKLYLEMKRKYFAGGGEMQAVLTEPMAEGLPNWITYANEQAWFIPLPSPHLYVLWQPWLKGYHGAHDTAHSPAWPRFVWIDQELKKAMGH
ncbi:hypothetical protein ES703_88636 [subsurface metagenome]